ncbi:hypothetical protein GGR56DRAFT_688239 [Xylariaceae sp. FL0804]|nr:hypothetical protein GGR56DRAFT_688239 [Xylariaceae sp. FL0804]
MLPPALVSSYRQYKADTDSIAGWLASTARHHGYVPQVSSTPAQAQGPGRLKGKARAQSKNKQSSGEKQHIIQIKEFVPMAQYISAKPSISVPVVVKRTLDRVISIRSEFATRLEEHGTVRDKFEDLAHEFFTGVLTQVRDLLRPLMSPSVDTASAMAPVPGADKKSGTARSMKNLTNRFAGLTVQETVEELPDEPEIERPKRVKGDNIPYEAEPSLSIEDFLITLDMVFNDLSDIREAIKSIWTGYKQDTHELTSAAVATNTGVSIARDLLGEVEPLFKDFGGIQAVLGHIYDTRLQMKGINTSNVNLEFWNKDRDPPLEHDLFNIMHDNYMLTYECLAHEIEELADPELLPLYKETEHYPYDPHSDRASKPGVWKLVEDRELLKSVLCEMKTITCLIPKGYIPNGYPVEDEFMRGAREAFETNKIPFSFVFAADVYLDIHSTLRCQARRPYEHLKTVLDSFLIELHQHIPEPWDDDLVDEDHKKMRSVAEILVRINQDPAYLFKKLYLSYQGQPLPDYVVRHKTFMLSPVLSGLTLHFVYTSFSNLGIYVANFTRSIMSAMHLYNAIRSENGQELYWTDMEAARRALGDSNFFVGDRPKTWAEYNTKFRLQMGTPAAAFARGRRHRIPRPTPRSAVRGIKDVAPVSSFFMERYVHTKGQADWTSADIAKILEQSRFGRGEMEQDTPGKNDEEDKGKKKGKAPDYRSFRPHFLLFILQAALQAERLELVFPYLLFHRECWSMLQAVHKQCEPLLGKQSPRDRDLPWVVQTIFQRADEDGDMRLLRAAEDALKEFIEDRGSNAGRFMHEVGLQPEVLLEKAATEASFKTAVQEQLREGSQ